MEYKVIPFHPTVTDKGVSEQAAAELQTVINKELSQGWKFKSIQTITTNMKATGCAGIFKPAAPMNIQLIVLEK